MTEADLVARWRANIAIVENATVAVAHSLSAFDFVPGDINSAGTPARDWWSCRGFRPTPG